MVFLSFEEAENLKWAIGETGRTTFVWTIAPPGTEFTERSCPVEDYYLSIFKWTVPLWSALDIMIDEDFIFYLRDNHTRKDFNNYFTGVDNDYLKAPRNVRKRPLPVGNHVISICLAAGILQKNRQSRFSLRDDLLEKETWQQIDAVTEALQNYLEKVQVPRELITANQRYLEKQNQQVRYEDNQLMRDINKIWNEAKVSQMKDIPADENLRDLIRKKLMDEDFVPSLSKVPSDLMFMFRHSTRPWTEEENEQFSRWHVREAWKDVRKDISDRVQEKLKQYAAAGHEASGDKDAVERLVLEVRQEVLRELAADLKTDDSK
jgi:hypothetical protein